MRFSKILAQIFGAVWASVPPYLRTRRLFGLAVLWLTIVTSALFFLPRVTVDPSGPYDPSNPLPTTFTISNNNIVPLRDVQVFLGLCYVAPSMAAPPQPECNGPSLSRLVKWKIKWLDVDEKYQIAMEDLLRTPDGKTQIEKANITIGITYTPWWMPSIWRTLENLLSLRSEATVDPGFNSAQWVRQFCWLASACRE